MKYDDSLFDDTPVEKDSQQFDDSLFDDNLEESPSKTESLLRGSAQGLTFNLSDELTGATEAGTRALLPEALGGDKFSDLLQNYRKYRDESRAANKIAEEANPGTYFTGELGAGLATGLFTGGAGTVANLGKVGLQQGAKELAKLGAKQGAVAALGASEADLTKGEIGQATKDTTVGAVLGAGLGATIPTAIKAVGTGASKVASFAKDKAPEFIKKGQSAFDLAKKGVNVVGTKAQEDLDTEANKVANKIIESFRSQYEDGSKKVNAALKSLPESVDFSKQMVQIEDALKNSKMLPDDLAKIQGELDLYKEISKSKTFIPKKAQAEKEMQDIVTKSKGEAKILGQNTEFIPQEATEDGKFLQTLKRTFSPEGDETASVIQVKVPETEVIENAVESFRKMNLQELNNVKKELSSFVGGNNKLSNYSKSILNNLKKQVDDAIDSSLSKENKALYESGNKDISDVYKAGDLMGMLSPNKRFENDLDIKLKQKLLSGSTTNKETIDRALQYGNNIPSNVAEKVQDFPVRQQLLNNLAGEGSLLGGLINPKGMSIRTGAALGSVADSPILNKTKDFTKKMINLDQKALENIASKVDPVFGTTLQKALQDTSKKDRLLWSLSQQPAFRQAVEKIENEESQQSMDINN